MKYISNKDIPPAPPESHSFLPSVRFTIVPVRGGVNLDASVLSESRVRKLRDLCASTKWLLGVRSPDLSPVVESRENGRGATVESSEPLQAQHRRVAYSRSGALGLEYRG
jgi:hypothetical protein